MPRVSGTSWPFLIADDTDRIVGMRSGNADQFFAFSTDVDAKADKIGVSELSSGPAVELKDKLKVRKTLRRDWLGRGNGVDDDTSRINGFIAAAVSAGTKRIYVDEGNYVFSNSGLAGHTAFAERCGVLVNGAQDLEIVCEGATLTFAGTNRTNYGHLVKQVGCTNTKLIGLNLRYNNPPFAWGEVTNKGATYFDVTLEVAYPTWSDVQRIEIYDPERRLNLGVIWQKTSAYESAGRTCTQQSASVMRVDMTGLSTELAAITQGDYLNLTHQIYGAQALQFSNCVDSFVTDTQVSHAAGMLVRMDDCDLAVFDHLRCRASSDQLIACTADGIHTAGLRRQLFVDNCKVSDLGDDGMNVHTRYYPVQSLPGGTDIVISAPSTVPGSGQPPPRVGDNVLFLKPDGSLDAYTGTILSITTGATWTLTLSATLPGGISTSWLIASADAVPDVYVRGSVFERIRGSAMLIQSRQAIIQGNTAKDVTNAMVSFWQFQSYFGDGVNPKNIVIEGNTAFNCLRWNVNAAVIMGFAEDLSSPGNYSPAGALENVYVRNNVIQGGANAGIWLASVSHGSVVGNDIQGLRHEDTSSWNSAGAFEIALENCADLVVAGNRSIGSTGLLQTISCTDIEEGLNPAFTRLSPVTLGAGRTEQFPFVSLHLLETTHATSKRASFRVGDLFFIQDTAGSGTKDFGIYHNATNTLIFKVSSTGAVELPGIPSTNPGGSKVLWNDGGTVKIT